MPLPGLTIIGETINDSVPSTKKLFDAGDIAGILEIAKMQDEKGAAYIDVNVGPRLARVHGRNGREDSGRDRQAALDRHARSGHRRSRLEGLQPRPRRRQKADHQLDQRACGPACSISTRSSPSSRSCWCRRTWSTAARSPATPPRRPSRRRPVGQRRFDALPRRDQRRLHHRPRHRPDRQRFGGQYPSADRRDGVDPRRRHLRRLPCLGRPEQLHGDAAAEAARRLAGQRGAGKRVSHQGHAAGVGHGHRLGEAELRIACRPTIPP